MKKIAVALSLAMMMMVFAGCNKTIIDTNWKFDTAIITLGDETKTVQIKNWDDHEGGTVQVVDKDGNVYLTHYTNIVLIATGK